MKKLKIGYYCADINLKKTKSIGILKVVRYILKELEKEKRLEIILILNEESKKYFKKFKCKKFIIKKNRRKYVFNKLFFYPMSANKFAIKNKLDLLFFPKGHVPFKKYKNIKYIGFMHDLIPLYYLKKWMLSFLIVSILLIISAKRFDLIFTNSNFSKHQISKFTSKKIIVVPLGSEKYKCKKPLIKKDCYVFIIGNRNPHKNLERSIELLKEYNKIKGTNYKGIFSNGEMTDEELAGYYRDAKFTIFLSSIEGFGLPLIESYNYLTPVVFNNKTSLKEIGVGLPGACDIYNSESVFRAMDEVIKLSKKQKIGIRAKLMKKYNWNNCGGKIIKALMETNL